MGVLKSAWDIGIRPKTIIFTAVISLMTPITSTAQDTPPKTTAPAPEAKQVQDYSKGFAVFYKLGLPDVSKAEYMTVYTDRLNEDFRNDLSEIGLTGNGWLLKKEGEAAGIFVLQNAITLNIYDGKTLIEEFNKRKGKSEDEDSSEFQKENRQKALGEWKKADLKKDISTLISTIEKINKENVSDRSKEIGTLFLYAIHIHSKGFKDEANKIIAKLFELAEDKKIVLLAAINCLADEQYNQAILNLQLKGDWKKFASDLEELLKKYPTGWKNAPGVKLLLSEVNEQLKSPTPPEIKGEGISEEDKKLAEELANEQTAPCKYGIWWLINQPDPDEKKQRTDTAVIEKIMNKGKAALPLMIALLKDNYMTPSCGIDYESYIFAQVDGKATTPEYILAGIPHPYKRKDFVREVLEFALIEEKGTDIDEIPDDEFAKLCEKLYETIKDKSREELIIFYAKNGNTSQLHDVISELLQDDMTSNTATIEEIFLNMENEKLIEHLTSGKMNKYIARRKKEALPFIEKLKEKFKDELKEAGSANKENQEKSQQKDDETNTYVNEDENQEYENQLNDRKIRQYQKLKKTLEMLPELTVDKDAKTIIAEILSGKKKIAEPSVKMQLVETLKSMDPEEAIGILLEGSCNAQDPIIKLNIMVLIPELTTVYEQKRKKDQKDKPLSIEKNAAGWKKLLADKSNYNRYPISAIAASIMDSIYGSKHTHQEEDEIEKRIGGERLFKLLIKRAEERLAGKTEKELTPFPNLAELDQDSQKKLEEKLLKAIAENNVPTTVESLNDREFAAVPKLTESNPKLNDGLRSYANRIVFISVELAGEEKAMDTYKNTVLDKNAANKIQDYCKKLTFEKKSFTCHISRKSPLCGIAITIIDPVKLAKMTRDIEQYDNHNKKKPAMRGCIMGASGRVDTIWEIPEKGEKAEPEDKTKTKIALQVISEEDATEENSTEKFEECLENELGKTGSSIHILDIYYYTK